MRNKGTSKKELKTSELNGKELDNIPKEVIDNLIEQWLLKNNNYGKLNDIRQSAISSENLKYAIENGAIFSNIEIDEDD